MKRIAFAAALVSILGMSDEATAQAKAQAAGMIDYFKLLNARDGGINGVKMTWEKLFEGKVTTRRMQR